MPQPQPSCWPEQGRHVERHAKCRHPQIRHDVPEPLTLNWFFRSSFSTEKPAPNTVRGRGSNRLHLDAAPRNCESFSALHTQRRLDGSCMMISAATPIEPHHGNPPSPHTSDLPSSEGCGSLTFWFGIAACMPRYWHPSAQQGNHGQSTVRYRFQMGRRCRELCSSMRKAARQARHIKSDRLPGGALLRQVDQQQTIRPK